jgi:hypothetical protein
MARHLPPNYGVATDLRTGDVVGALGHQADLPGFGSLFLAQNFAPAQVRLVARTGISYIAVDMRLSRQLPEGGSYFNNDPRAGRYTSPIPAADLEKFNSVGGVSRLFDDGTIQLYDVADTANVK